ncbi:dockerin type I repeat-containing protein, partial [Candidatus Woesearchaeota archaeon]|nr:dockerin type I repeat-containing protein [Candidatus Woesearchaeota archaeon]
TLYIDQDEEGFYNLPAVYHPGWYVNTAYLKVGASAKIEGDLEVQGNTQLGYDDSDITTIRGILDVDGNIFINSAEGDSLTGKATELGSAGISGIFGDGLCIKGMSTGYAGHFCSSDVNAYSGYFTGGKGVLIKGDLEVTGECIGCGTVDYETGYVKGDCNKSGVVNMEDAKCIYDYRNGRNTKCDDPLVDCDVDGDGVVGLSDAMFLGQILSGKINPTYFLPFDSIASISPYAYFRAYSNLDALKADATGSTAYAGYFTGGKGVKIEGDLEVNGKLIQKYDLDLDGSIAENDLVIMKQMSVGMPTHDIFGEVIPSSRADLDNNGISADAGDLGAMADMVAEARDNYYGRFYGRADWTENEVLSVKSENANIYSGYFSGGKGVKVEGDLDVSGDSPFLSDCEWISTDIQVNANSVQTETAICPPNKNIVSGGGSATSTCPGSAIRNSYPHLSGNGWQVIYHNGCGIQVTLSVYAYCCK